jgi:hypothetical protein
MRGGLRVVGYHGTSEQRARLILRHGFEPSANAFDWLGTGIYFFEENERRAHVWARKRHPAAPAVLGAVIDLSGVLDLTEQVAIDALKETATTLDQLHARLRGAKQMMPNKPDGRRYFDRLLLDLCCAAAEHAGGPYRVVRGAFEEGAVIHPASSIRELTHTQLAVRDARAILGVWRART